MAEVAYESTQVWSSKIRITLFLSAMRHFRDRLRGRGITVHYRRMDSAQAFWENGDTERLSEGDETLEAQLSGMLRLLRPQSVVMVEPGEWRVRQELETTVRQAGIPLTLCVDRHFFCSSEDFQRHASQRKQLRLEYFYREWRQRTGVLMEGNLPAGGQWNFDAENRESFGRNGPGFLPAPIRFPPDAITVEVIQMVQTRFTHHPGSLDRFDWPVTAEAAREALQDFILHRLPEFGRWQDAMWTGEPWLYHSRLSAALNLKLISPREVVLAAENAWKSGSAPLSSVEGFIRQILGWREYVRGIYWHFMPGYLDRNALNAGQPLPDFYWTGETDLNCLRQALRQTLDLGYSHHIQRLMVTGLFSLLLGVRPQAVHEWYLAVYVDAVEWVELPNTLGMSQFADGGVMASKPYIASGKYIDRMSNSCASCRFDPAQSVGPKACPFTTLYWDFLIRHEDGLSKNPRMGMQLRNLARLSPSGREQIRKQAEVFRSSQKPI